MAISSAGPSRWARLALLLFTLFLIAGIGEIGARCFLDVGRAEQDAKIRQRAESGTASLNPKYIRRNQLELPTYKTAFDLAQKHANGVHKGVRFRTNDIGFRGPDYSLYPEPGVFRILLTGDSVTMGEGVEERLIYSNVAEQLLADADPSRKIEIINAGLSGSNLSLALTRLRQGIRAYHPQLLVYGYTINDIEGKAYVRTDPEERKKFAANQESWMATSRFHLLRFLAWRWNSVFQPRDPRDTWLSLELHRNYFESDAAWDGFTSGLDSFAATAHAKELCALVLIHTHLNFLDDHPYVDIYDKVEAAARERGLPVATTFEKFEDQPWKPYWIGYFDPHPNPAGHALLAESLAEGLSALPERCWNAEPAPTRKSGASPARSEPRAAKD